MSFLVNEQKVGAAAGAQVMAELKANPELVNQIVTAAMTALVEALVKNLPAIIAGVQQAFVHEKATQDGK